MKILEAVKHFLLKYSAILVVLVILIFIGFIFYSIFDANKITLAEERFYKWAQLIMLGIVAFGILRLYNAVIVNSSFIKKLNAQIGILVAEIKTLERSITQDSREHRSSVQSLRNSLDGMRSSILLWISKLK